MRKLGLIGGTSWHSTIEYYRIINQTVNDHFGNNTNPPLMVYTLNQALIHQHQIDGNWLGIADELTLAAEQLQKAGAEQLMFCANTPHKVYDVVKSRVSVPILHIADATAQAIQSLQIDKVCFLGTKYSMQETFVRDVIQSYGIEVLVPQKEETMTELHRIIQKELTYGNIIDQSKAYVLEVINDMIAQGAKGVVLGCTEFPLMIHQEDLQIPIFDTTKIHALAGVNYILQDIK